ncbi:MAG: hypothetical protein RSC00_01645 [Ruthenibacterium sp.]
MMEIVKQWTLSVCMACLVAGILQQFTASRTRFSVIKLVLTLYILVTAFAPLQAMRYPETRMSMPVVAQMTPVDTDALILEAARKNLTETITMACAAGGCAVSEVQVHLSVNDGMVTVTGVTLQIPDTANEEKAKLLALDALGSNVPVALQRGG